MTAARVRTWLLRAWVALVFAFLMLPVVVIALASLSRTSYLTVPPRGLTLRWFTAVLADPEYVHAIGFSVLLALVATAGSLASGVAASFALLHRRVRGGAAVAALLNAPLLVHLALLLLEPPRVRLPESLHRVSVALQELAILR